MTGIIDKVKEVLHKDSSSNTTTHGTSATHGTSTTHGTGVGNTHSTTTGVHSGSTNAGPHSSNVANKADPRVDSDLDSSRHNGGGLTGSSNTGTYGTTGGSTNAGPHNSNIANKADPRVDSDLDSSRHTGHSTTGHHSGGVTSGLGTSGSRVTPGAAHGSTNAGPHNSNIANKADPRVDSDLDSSRHAGHSTTGHSTTGYSSGTTHGSTNAGPHNSNIANKVDPRVDSDLDSSHRNGGTSGYGNSGSGVTGTHGSGNTTAPHSSNVANKLDPRIDSDRTTGAGGVHSGTTHGNTVGGTGFSGGLSSSSNAGPHQSNVANKADPRVDSDLSGSGNRHGANNGGVFGASGSHATAGSGTAQNTQGPHNSDLLNKLDPRVDSDGDHSKTIGGNATHR